MNHARHYTVEEANAELDRVAELLARLRTARSALTDEETRGELSSASPGNGGGAPGRRVSEAFLELGAVLAAFRDLELVLRDADRGLVDFPALRDGEEVYLCWEEGEAEIGFWHDPEAGYGGRRPL